MKNSWNVVLGLAVIVALGIGAWFLFDWLWTDVLPELNTNVLASLGVGIVATITALWVKRIEHKHAIDAQFRSQKAELYLEFRQALDNISDRPQDELVEQLKEMRAKLLLWGGPSTVKDYEELVAALKGFGEISTVKQLVGAARSMGKFYLSMRKDLGLSNRELTAEDLGLSIVRHPQLILQAVKENPDMTLDQLSKLEKELEKEQNK